MIHKMPGEQNLRPALYHPTDEAGPLGNQPPRVVWGAVLCQPGLALTCMLSGLDRASQRLYTTGVEIEQFKRLRRRLGLTQKGLAQELGVSLPTVGRWECGMRRISPLAARATELLLEVERLKKQLAAQGKEQG